MLTQPNLRIARAVRTEQGAVLRWEVLGSWFYREQPGMMGRILRELADAQAEEPWAGWELQTQGTERPWHAIQPGEVTQ